MLVDTHCHLNFKAFKKDTSEIIKRAEKNSICKIIIPGAKLDSSITAVKIAKKYSNCYAAVGIHPHHAKDFSSDTYEKLLTLAKNDKVVAIGEIGLDYHQYTNYPPVSDRNKILQEELLLIQLDVARILNLPVIFHARDSQDDLLDFLEEYIINTGYRMKGVFHCFEGNQNHLIKALTLGFYVGYDGNITYEENSRLRELIKQTPLEKLLLETDSPYLTPIPYRNNRNEPSYLVFIADKVADIHHKSILEVTMKTSQNAVSLFHL